MKKLLVIAIAVLGFGLGSQAQEKLAHIDSRQIADSLPSSKAAQKTLMEEEAKAKETLLALQKKIEDLEKEIVKNEATWDAAYKEYKIKAFQEEQMKAQQTAETKQNDLQILSQRLNLPIMQRMQKAVDNVAAKMGFTYVFDVSQLMYFKGGKDITKEVLTEALRLEKEEAGK